MKPDGHRPEQREPQIQPDQRATPVTGPHRPRAGDQKSPIDRPHIGGDPERVRHRIAAAERELGRRAALDGRELGVVVAPEGETCPLDPGPPTLAEPMSRADPEARLEVVGVGQPTQREPDTPVAGDRFGLGLGLDGQLRGLGGGDGVRAAVAGFLGVPVPDHLDLGPSRLRLGQRGGGVGDDGVGASRQRWGRGGPELCERRVVQRGGWSRKGRGPSPGAPTPRFEEIPQLQSCRFSSGGSGRPRR